MRKKILYFLITLFGTATLVSGYVWHLEIGDQRLVIGKIPIISEPDKKKLADEIKITDHRSPITNDTTELQISPTLSSAAPPTSLPPETIPEKKYEVTVTLKINENSLAIPYVDQMTAEDAMKNAMKKYPDKFSYSGIAYGEGLGTFVEEINNIRENYKEKMHWILYINGKKSNKGISILILKPDDTIMWNYEKEIL